MITGYNTDIEFNGVVYHVQTEDKGPAVPMILSLVYDRGTILASKRANYEDLGTSDIDEKIAERLQRQHKLICAAVMAGRIDDLKRMSAVAREQKRSANGGGSAVETIVAPDTVDGLPVEMLEPEVVTIAATNGDALATPIDQPPDELGAPIPMPNMAPLANLAALDETELTILDTDVSVLEEYSLLSPEDLQIVSDLAGLSRPEHDKLSIDFIGSPEFKGGKSTSAFVLVCRGSRGEVIRGSDVMVKVLGSSFRPVIYHSGTDKNGLATIDIDVPNFNSGRAIVLARAINSGEEVEVRRPVYHG